MSNFRHRKLFLILFLSVALFSLYTLVPFLRNYIIPIGVFLVFLCLLLGGMFGEKIRFGSVIFIFLAFLMAFASVTYAYFSVKKSEAPLAYVSADPCEIKGKVTQVSNIGTYSSSYMIDVIEIGGEPANFSASLEIEKITFFEYGDIISCSAVFEKSEETALYLRGKNIFVVATAEDAISSSKAEKDIGYYLHTANEYLCERMIDMMGKEAGGFCAAIILGNRTYVSSGMRLDFARVGISHLLALSGLHLSVLAQTLDFILRGFLKKKYRNVILIIACFTFAFFTGLSASVIRASIMLCAVFAADMFGEENDSLTALSIAAFLILLFDPNSVYDIGFWLSVCATLGIILMRPATDALFYRWQKPRKNKLLRVIYEICKYFYGIFSMSIAAFFFTLPLSYFCFGEVSVIGVISNFVFLPLATVLLVLCVFFVPLSFVPYVSKIIAFICGNLAEFILDIAHFASDIKGIGASLEYPFSPFVFGAFGICLIICIFIKRLSLSKICALFLSLGIAFFSCLGVYSYMTNGDVNVSVKTSKSGEFVSFKAGNENYVVDISTGKYTHMYEALMSVKDFACTEVDNLVLTHYHLYHQNSIYRLADIIKIRNVLLPSPETEEEEERFYEIKETLEKCGIDYTVYTRSCSYIKGDVKIDFAPLYKISRSEKPIVAFKISASGATFSYVESAAFEGIYDYGEYLSSDVILIGSHGPSRKFRVSATELSASRYVIFAKGNEEYFRDTEALSDIRSISENDDIFTILYDN